MAEAHRRRVHTEDVVLDIGDDAGALIIYTTPDLAGKEIELSRHGEAARTHTDVHERVVNGRTLYTAVYPSLPAGRYTVWGLDGAAAGAVTISGGQVTEVDWRDLR